MLRVIDSGVRAVVSLLVLAGAELPTRVVGGVEVIC